MVAHMASVHSQGQKSEGEEEEEETDGRKKTRKEMKRDALKVEVKLQLHKEPFRRKGTAVVK